MMNKKVVILRSCFFILSALLLSCTLPANAVQSKTVSLTFDGLDFRAVFVKPEQVNLHWLANDGQPFQRLSTLKKSLSNKNVEILALMNAGIYGKDNKPAGLHIENGQVLQPLNTNKGHGNFHIQPNGVFLIDEKARAKVVTTAAYKIHYQAKQHRYQLATQSGPMLVINGKLNRRLLPKSQSNYTRNGVCTTRNGQLLFIATDGMRSNFYQFARASQQFGCHNTLYLDGSISKLYVSGENTSFHFAPFVGILSVTQPRS